MARKRIGPARVVRVVSASEIAASPGKYRVSGKVAKPIAVEERTSRILGGPIDDVVYVISDADIASGKYGIEGGAAQVVVDSSFLPSRKFADIKHVIPVYIMSGSFPVEEVPLVEPDYFVDATGGNDAWNGLTSDTAWQTVAKVNGETFSPSDFIAFKRGETWREKLTVPDSGSAGKPIAFGAYGSGSKPVISGANLMTGFAADATVETWGDNTTDDNTGITEDTHVQGGINSGNNYNTVSLKTRNYSGANNAVRKAFLRFDLSGGTGTVTAATLNLNQLGTDVAACILAKCTRAWVEATATWDDYDGSNPWGANHDQSTTLISFNSEGTTGYKVLGHADFLTYIQSVWGSGEINISIHTDEEPDQPEWRHSEGTDGQRPFLSITTGQTNVYNVALVDGGSGPAAVYFDGTQGALAANKAALASNDDWFWAANVLSIYSDSDPSAKVIEAAIRNQCVDQNEKSYLRFENIKLDKSKLISMRIDGNATDITLNAVDSDKSFNDGFQVGVTGGAAVTPSNVTFDGCAITLFNREDTSQAPGILQFNGTSGGDNLIIRNCTISSDVDTDNSGNAEDGIIVMDGDDILIENNVISGVDHGIQMRGSGVGSKDVETFTIRYNTINSFDDAIWLRGTSEADSTIYYNLITGSGDSCFDIIGEGGTIYNNTCYDGRSNAVTLQTLAATKVIFKNNILSNTANDASQIYIDDSNSVDISNSTFDNNLYYRVTPSADFYSMSGGGGDNFADWQSTHSQDASGLNENPDFTTPGSDFTLQAVSPCRDAGADVSLTPDYAGVSVPQETNPAIGAYEYTG